eukprot:g5785.t1
MQAATSAAAARTERPARQAAAARSSGFEPSRPPCRFFLLGKCKFGDACTFSHDPQRVPVCSFFESSGTCRYGNSCKFLHGSSSSSSSNGDGSSTGHDPRSASATTASASSPMPVQQQGGEEASSSAGADAGGDGDAVAASAVAGGGMGLEATEGEDKDRCGICLENIPASGKRFGLLNCDHVYCLECLRTWRKSKGPQKDISRTCPECRKVSFFLVPSKEHLKGKAKLKAIQAYKKGLSKLPCKYHKPARSGGNGSSSGTNVCPFGARCFYAHLDENGNDVKDRTPAPPASSRRSCPYLRGGGGGGGGRGGARGGGGGGRGRAGRGHGLGASGEQGLDDLQLLYPFEVEEFTPDLYGRQVSVIMRLQQLMLENAQDFL